jgi:DNA-binding SARP family transcriptional activator/tetratricopeptide (TPR) repeat protein
MIRLRALGQCLIEVGGHAVTPESDVLFALLLFLSSSGGQTIARSDLLDLFWPESTSSRARHRLRQALYQLKKLGAPLDRVDSVIAVREAEVECDYVTYARSRQAVVRWACGATRLDYLPHYAPTFSPRFARWVEAERERVCGTLRGCLLAAIVEARTDGDHEDVIALARACLRLDPLSGEATFALVESLAVSGSRGEALGLIDQYRIERRSDDEAVRAAVGLRRRILELSQRRGADAFWDAPLTGRTAILGELTTWIASQAPEARILALSGEPGIGKTRLLNEGVRIATLKGMRCVEYRPSAAGGERPLAGLFDLLPHLLSLPGAVGCSPASYARLTELARGVQVEASIPEDRSDSAFRFATLRRSVLDLVEAVLAETGVLVVIDDAHALDRPSLEILLDGTRCPGNRFSLLIATRPFGPTTALLNGRTDVRAIRVPPLGAGDARAILTRDLGPEVAAQQARLVDWAVDLANGNPFFLMELSGHCRRARAGESLPVSLHVALDRKIDGLLPTARLVLQTCAVLGDHSTFGRVEATLGLAPHEMARALSELEAAGLVAFRDGRVACRHDLVSDAVLRSSSTTLGRYLHRRCAAVLDDELRVGPSASLAWDCARHFDAAEEPARALELTSLIADQLLYLGLPKEAADLCTRAERYCQTPEQNADRLLRLSRAHRLLYDWEKVVNSLVERRAFLVGARVPTQRFSDDDIALFEARWWRDYDARILRPAVKRVLDTKAPTLYRLQMAVLALIVADNQNEKRDADRLAEAVESLETHTPREDTEKSKARLIFHTAFGDLEVALAAGTRLVEVERRSGNSAGLWRALRWISLPMRLSDDKAGAVDVLVEAYNQASRLNLRGDMWNAAFYLKSAALEYEDLDLALEWAPIVAELTRDATAHTLGTADCHYTRARIEFMRGDFAQAREYLEQSRSLKTTLSPARGEQSLLALDVLLRVRSGQAIPRALLNRLYRLHVATRDSGVWDFETAAVVSGLIHTKKETEAVAVYDYYTRVRRSRIARHPLLFAVQSMLPGRHAANLLCNGFVDDSLARDANSPS